MIPRIGISQVIDVKGLPPEALSSDLRMRSWSFNREHEPLAPGDWDYTEVVIAEESEVVRRADANSTTAREFEDLLAEVESLHDYEWAWLDVGVAGAVYALNAAGFATEASCRSHPGMLRNACPFVALAGDESRVSLLTPLIESSGCSAEAWPMEGFPGGFVIFAPSVASMLDLAASLVAHKSDFMALPETIPWDETEHDPEDNY